MVGDEAMARLRVDAPQRDEEQADQPEQADANRAEQAPGAAATRCGRLGDFGLLRHQKAWPSET